MNHYKMLSIKLFLALLVTCAAVLALASRSSAHGGLPPCGPTATFVQPTPTTGANIHPLSGIVPIDFMTAPNATRVIFELDGEIIGQGQSMGTANDFWQMIWDTRYAESTTDAELTAEVTYQSGQICESISFVDVSINNPVEFDLDADLLPPYWQGPTNSVGWFDVLYEENTGGASFDISPFAVIDWSVSDRGTITGLLNSVGRFYSGPQVGMGEVYADIQYGGSSIEIEAIVDVIGQYDDTTYDDSGDNNDDFSDEFDDEDQTQQGPNAPEQDDDAAAGIQRTAPMTFAEHVETYLRSNPIVSDCVQDELGYDADTFANDNRRPSRDEFETLVDCFSEQDYVVPSILAPVAPDEVVRKKRSDAVEINSVTNRDVTSSSGSTQTALVLSGTAAPNTKVIIYVFSEPLVLVATANDEGLWEYVLEDPLPGGEHEVYALIDRGDGEYERSNLASFFIGTAEATEDNPNGLSLELVSEPTIGANNRSVNVFIAATIGLTVFAGTLLTGYLLYRFRAGSDVQHQGPTNSA